MNPEVTANAGSEPKPSAPSPAHEPQPEARWSRTLRISLFAIGVIAGGVIGTLAFWTPLALLPATALGLGAFIAPGRSRRAATMRGGVVGAALPWFFAVISPALTA